MQTDYRTHADPTFDKRNALLSATVDALTVVIEDDDDRRLRLARELVLNVALPPVVVILIDREELAR